MAQEIGEKSENLITDDLLGKQIDTVESERKLENENKEIPEIIFCETDQNPENLKKRLDDEKCSDDEESDKLIIDEGMKNGPIIEDISQDDLELPENNDIPQQSSNIDRKIDDEKNDSTVDQNFEPTDSLEETNKVSYESDLEESFSDDDKPISVLIQPETLVEKPILFISNTDEPPPSSAVDKNSNGQRPGSVIRNGLLRKFEFFRHILTPTLSTWPLRGHTALSNFLEDILQPTKSKMSPTSNLGL